jgi:glycerol-3-phosphate dehydrogenase (NAD(P)+)
MKIAIIGAGSFGTAIAEALSGNPDNKVELYAIEQDIVDSINNTHINTRFFPSRKLNENLQAHNTLDFVKDSEFIFLTVPSSVIEKVTDNLIPHLGQTEKVIINLAKGLANDGRILNEVIKEKLAETHQVCSLKGPTFAIELLNGVPSALTLASENKSLENKFLKMFRNTNIKIDFTQDVRGVELLSVLKNVYAIAIGIIGAKFNSPNVTFMVFTKAFNEIMLILKTLKCSDGTASMFCGIGDLGLTSLNDLSRNRTLGLFIGKGFYDGNSSNQIVLEGLRSISLFSKMLSDSDIKDSLPILLNLNKLIIKEITTEEFIKAVLK